MKTLFQLLFIVLLSSVFGRSYSQFISPEDTLGWCSTDTSEYLPLNNPAFKSVNTDKTIKVVFNIYWADTLLPLYENSYIPEPYVINAFNDLVEAFTGTGIYFELEDIKYIEYSSIPFDFGDALINNQQCIPIAFAYPGFTNMVLNPSNEYPLEYHPKEYMNVYVFPIYCNPGVAGFAYVPPYGHNLGNGPSLGDGVWVKSRNFGNEDHPGTSTSFHKNRVLIHEVGHYLGLYHTFQNTSQCGYDPGGDYYYGPIGCNITGDLVCDTAPTKIAYGCQPVCPPGLWDDDAPWANYQPINHMGYYAEVCRNEFTPGQIDRMHAYLEAYRPEVYSGDCSADFNQDGLVGTADLLQMLSCMESDAIECEICDLDGNGVITIFDFLRVLGQYGQICDPFYMEVKPTQIEREWNLKY